MKTDIGQERLVDLQGFVLALKEWNAQKSRPVLCLHGMLDNAASFDFLASCLPDFHLVAIDYPGTGHSAHYSDAIFPHWKSDAFLITRLIKELKWEKFDIVAHSLGSLLASFIAVLLPEHVGKIVFLDILGPKVNFMEHRFEYLHKDLEIFLTYQERPPTVFSDKEAAIRDRMSVGNISYQAADALVNRGVEKNEKGWSWTFDRRLHCVASTVPYEDEITFMFQHIESPVCLVRAQQGVPYPADVFQQRAKALKNLVIHEVPGGHHVHMDDPERVAKIINEFLR